jgi:hypothetical protein
MNTHATKRTVAVMQPYLFPYIGYFQLAARSDRFVFSNDRKFINGGWINRNRLRVNNEPSLFTVPLRKPSGNCMIDEAEVLLDDRFMLKFKRTMQHHYARAPHLEAIADLCDAVFSDPPKTIDQLASRSVCSVMAYLGLPFDSCDSRGRYDNDHLKGEARVIDTVLQENGTHYLNLPGGRELYNAQHFADVGLTLGFIESVNEPYRQTGEPFMPFLSILDVLLWNDREVVCRWLQDEGGSDRLDT